MNNYTFLNEYYFKTFNSLPQYTPVPFEYREESLKKLKKSGLSPEKETYLATYTFLENCLISGGYEHIEVDPYRVTNVLTEFIVDYKKLQDRVEVLEETVRKLSNNHPLK